MSKLGERHGLTRKIVRQAIQCIETHAEALRESHCIPFEYTKWGDGPQDRLAKREYERMRRLIKALKAA